MNFRGGRDRPRREFSPRFEQKGHFERSNAPPSRHLWVGNLSPHVTETTLSEQFLRFGEVESIAFLPGRCYAFVNFKKEEDALIAMRGLQGFVVAGLPLKIEFTKGEKQLASSHAEEFPQKRHERHPEFGESFRQRDSRIQSPERYSFAKSKGDKNAEPSEVLWLGFPSFLNVDEMILRRAFSPFGEIEKISAFPGRSYAFVQFRSVVAACRAKEALQGKLFNNPRVSICFARSEEHGRNPKNAPFPSHIKSNERRGPGGQAIENVQPDKHLRRSSGEFRTLSPNFVPDIGNMTRDPGPFSFGRNAAARGGSEDLFEHHKSSPAVDRGSLRRDFPQERPPKRTPFFEESWDMPDESFPFRDAKKLKMCSFPEKELPEYPFFDAQQQKQSSGLPKLFPDLPECETYDKNFESVSFDLKRIKDHSNNLPRTERDDLWNTHDSFESGADPLPTNPARWHRSTPDSHQSPFDEEWKWEGTIAKGGTPVCRARCFPVGKVLDVMLPEFLNCTARTGLDMLAKHFYQAANFWVVFFVPQSDTDMVFYNEFMHYLGEKQRAAVTKLSEKTTLFLVPPSDFSEKVLKVPGKVSISGVILRFQHPSSHFSSHPMEAMDSKLPPLAPSVTDGVGFHDDMPYAKPNSPDSKPSSWGNNYISPSTKPFPSTSSFPLERRPGTGITPYMERASNSLDELDYDQLQHQNPALPSGWSPHKTRDSISNFGNFGTQASATTSHPFDDSILQKYLSAKPRSAHETTSSQHTPGSPDVPSSGSKFSQHETKSQVSSMPVPPLQPEQLAQLATILGQRQQPGKGPVLAAGEDHSQLSLSHPLEQTLKPIPRASSQSQASASSETLASQFNQVQHLQQQTLNVSAVPHTTQTERQPISSESQINQLQNSAREETEADPQKRLQATLQLAAALLQQIQQQAKTV